MNTAGHRVYSYAGLPAISLTVIERNVKSS